MEPTFNTSFIPKHTPGQQPSSALPPEKRVRRRAVYGLGFFVSLLLFFLSGLSAIGVFVYTQIVQQTVEDLTAQLTNIVAELRPEAIQALIRDDTRLAEAKQLLANHAVVSGLLEELESVTLQEVQYRSAAYTEAEGASGALVLDGVTRDYSRVADQTDRFEGHGSFPLPVVTKLERGEGEVVFTLSMQVDPALVQFGNALERGVYRTGASQPNAAVEASAPSPTPSTAGATTTPETGVVTERATPTPAAVIENDIPPAGL